MRLLRGNWRFNLGAVLVVGAITGWSMAIGSDKPLLVLGFVCLTGTLGLLGSMVATDDDVWDEPEPGETRRIVIGGIVGVLMGLPISAWLVGWL